MNATVVNPGTSPDASHPADGPVLSGPGDQTPAGDQTTEAVSRIAGLRRRIDEIDTTIVELWRERAAVSGEVGRVRIASGGTRLVLAREREIVDRFRDALGADGVQLALLILRAGRGPL